MHSILSLPSRVLRIAVIMIGIVAIVSATRADIFQWEYINPADPSQGKRQSTTLTPDGAGAGAFPGADLPGLNLTKAHLIGAELSSIYSCRFGIFCTWDTTNLAGTNLTNADLTSANLGWAYLGEANLRGANVTNADFSGATLTNADFTDAEVRETSFFRDPQFVSGISLAQLYSTASYQVRDLTGIDLNRNFLDGGNFVGQNLTNASFFGATLIDADFTGAEVRGADFGNISDYGDGIDLAQLYSTASYQAHDLMGVGLFRNNLAGGNFVGQNLTNADLDASQLTGADLTGADVRGAFGLDYVHFGSATRINLIRHNGHIDGLDLRAGQQLVVRDYDGDSRFEPVRLPIPVTVNQQFAMGPGGTLRMAFEADTWDSTISFAPGIPVMLGGTLELTFAENVNLASQLGRTFDLFDWTGVNPIGTFAVASPCTWDLSNLYTTGKVTLASVPEPATFVLWSVALGVLLALRHSKRVPHLAATALPLILCANSAWADIYQWEYIDPADPSRGKQQSSTLSPDGAGVHPIPGADLSYRDLTMAYLVGADLRGAMLTSAYFYDAELTGANLSHASLANAEFRGATLTDVEFTGADVRGADFRGGESCNALICSFPPLGVGTGISLSQLYSTASYRAHDLSDVLLDSHHLDGADFAGQNLTNTSFRTATITDADFTGAEIKGANFGIEVQYPFLCGFISCNESDAYVLGTGIALNQLYSTASYESRNLAGIRLWTNNLAGANFEGQNLSEADLSTANLTNADFRHANLRHASLGDATLSGADFTGADVNGAYFGQAFGFTRNQLYSTASYQSHDLSSINLFEKNLSGWNFAGQKLFSSDFLHCVLNGADFTAADARGARLDTSITAATTTNFIWPTGHIIGLDLESNRQLVVRDYRNYFGSPAPFPIGVYDHLTMGPSGTLRMVFEADTWDSTISFAPGIPVMLGGTLELTFAENVNLASQLGRTFDLFDWTGVNPTGAFAISSPYVWDMSHIYTTGEVTLVGVPEPRALFLLGFALTAHVAMGRVRLRSI